MTVKLRVTAMCLFCGLHSEVEVICEHEDQIVPHEMKFRQKCDYCANKGLHVITELKGLVDAKEKVVFT